MAFCGCTDKTELSPVSEKAPAVVPVVLRGTSSPKADEAESKTSLGIPSGSTVPFLWERADRLGLFLKSGGTEITASDNAPVMLASDKGPGSNTGCFEGTLAGLEASTTYDVSIYYPWYVSSVTSSSAIRDRVHPHQVQAAPGSSAHIGRSGGFAVASSSLTTPSSLDGYTAEIDFELNHKTAYLQFNVSSAVGAYNGWLLKRITLTAPENVWLAGQTEWEPSGQTFKLLDTDARSNSVILDIENSQPLSVTAQTAYMVLFPASVKGCKLDFSYTLQTPDGSQTVVLSRSRQISASSLMFTSGSIYNLVEVIPAAAGGEWTASDEVFDEEYYRAKILGIAKRAGAPTLHVTYKDNLHQITVFVVNEDYYNTPDAIQEDFTPTEDCLYQAASVTKVTFNYIFWKMREEGYWSDLDQPVYELWPGVLDLFADDAKEMAKDITLRMLVTHTTGLDGSLNYGKFTFDAQSTGYYPGGNKYRYSNRGISILGWTMEYLKGYAKGQGLVQMGRDYIFDKLGMTLSNFSYMDGYDSIHLKGHMGTTWARNNATWGGSANAAYSLRSNSKEYMKFLWWMMHGADLSPETMTEMWDPQFLVTEAHTGCTTEMWRTLGWQREASEELGPVFRHSGSLPGFRSTEVRMIPERDAAFVTFCNYEQSYNVNDALFDLFMPHKEPFASSAINPVPSTLGVAGNTTVRDE